jgi:hypothetical protein
MNLEKRSMSWMREEMLSIVWWSSQVGCFEWYLLCLLKGLVTITLTWTCQRF